MPRRPLTRNLIAAFLAVSLVLAGQRCLAAPRDLGNDPRLNAAQQVVQRIASEVESSGLGQTTSSDFDPLAGTRKMLRILKSMDFLARNDGPRGEGTTTLILSEADVRRVPRADADRFALAAKGTRGRVLQIKDGWVRVAFDNGTEGWIEESHADYRSGRALVAGERGSRSRFVRTALAARGVPYVWGGATLRGLDCSGLVLNIARRFGVRLPHSAALQWKRGIPVARDALTPGDLVFFANTYKPGISHVGVYVGGGKFVHASSGRGRVTVSSLREPYYAWKYAGARRLPLPPRR